MHIATAFVALAFCASLAWGAQVKTEPAPKFVCPKDDPNGSFVHEEFCDKYYECAGGEAVLVTCPDGLLFDKKRALQGRSKCEEPFNNVNCGNRTKLQPPQPTQDGVCPRQNGRFEHQDPAVCDQYVECRHGTWTILQCAGGLQYSPEIGQCTWPAEAKRTNCGRRRQKLPDGFECPDSDQTATPGAGPKNPNPTYPHPTSCTQFYVCIGGTDPRLNVCNADLVYNIDTGTCDSYKNVPECAPVDEPAQ